MSSRYGRLREVFPVPPGGGLVVEGAGLEASVQDADEAVREPPQGVIVFDFAGAELVAEGSGTRGCVQRGERLGIERVDEAVVVDEPGRDDLLLARRAGNRTGQFVVLGVVGSNPIIHPKKMQVRRPGSVPMEDGRGG